MKTLSKKAEQKLLAYSWPGNIRELRNCIEHGVVMDYSETLEEEHFLIESDQSVPDALISLKDLEKEHILKTLEALGGNRTQAAKLLGISVRTLRNKLNTY
jgi:DNA-binding NtrC family response regulator